MSERVSAAAGVKPDELKAIPKSGSVGGAAGQGGPFVPFASGKTLSLDQLNGVVTSLDIETDQRIDVFTLLESRLLESRLVASMIPNSKPVDSGVGSGSGFRTDPFTERAALHTGLDFPTESGTPPPVGWCFRASTTQSTATSSKSITATAWSRGMCTTQGCS